MNKIEKLKAFFADKKEKTVKDYQKAIRDFGLVNDSTLPYLYGDERIYMEPYRENLGIYQTPIQFASLLKFLEPFEINSYCEIGVFRGGTFLFMKYFLQAKNPDVELICIDPTDNIHELAKDEILPHLKKATSFDFKNTQFDCVFIDGDHSFEWVQNDYMNIGQFSDICIFHDVIEPTCPGVVNFWNLAKSDARFNKNVEFTESLGGYKHQGIGVLYND